MIHRLGQTTPFIDGFIGFVPYFQMAGIRLK